MIHLVLRGAGQQARAVERDFSALKRLRAHVNLRGAPNVGIDLGDAQATFRADLLAFGVAELRVDEDDRHTCFDVLQVSVDEHLARLLTGGNVDDGEHEWAADLLGGESDAIGRVHGFNHVSCKLAKLGRDLLNPHAFLAQSRVTVLNDFQNHDNIIAKKQSVAKPDAIC